MIQPDSIRLVMIERDSIRLVKLRLYERYPVQQGMLFSASFNISKIAFAFSYLVGGQIKFKYILGFKTYVNKSKNL